MAEERTIWGIHMGLVHELRPVKEGYVAIGWKAVGNLKRVYIPSALLADQND